MDRKFACEEHAAVLAGITSSIVISDQSGFGGNYHLYLLSLDGKQASKEGRKDGWLLVVFVRMSLKLKGLLHDIFNAVKM